MPVGFRVDAPVAVTPRVQVDAAPVLASSGEQIPVEAVFPCPVEDVGRVFGLTSSGAAPVFFASYRPPSGVPFGLWLLLFLSTVMTPFPFPYWFFPATQPAR